MTIKERSWLEPGHRTPALPERLRHLSERASWKQIKPSPGRLPARQTVFDFGRQVSGYLEMELAEEGDAGLVFFGDEEPPAQEGRPSVIVSPFPGRRHWRDIKPRTFRYVALVGLPALRRLEVVEVPAEEAEAVDPGSPFRGVFGLPPAQPYLPVEEAVWDRLKELAAHPDDPSSDLDEDMAPSPADS